MGVVLLLIERSSKETLMKWGVKDLGPDQGDLRKATAENGKENVSWVFDGIKESLFYG